MAEYSEEEDGTFLGTTSDFPEILDNSEARRRWNEQIYDGNGTRGTDYEFE